MSAATSVEVEGAIDLNGVRLPKKMRTRVENVIHRGGFVTWDQLGAVSPSRVKMLKGCGPSVFKILADLVHKNASVADPAWTAPAPRKSVVIKPEEQEVAFNAMEYLMERYSQFSAEEQSIIDNLYERLKAAVGK